MTDALIVPDIHLGKTVSLGKPGIGSALNSRIVDQINILEWILDRALELNARNMILTGDCFEDPRPHPTIIHLFISWLKKCTDSDINVHIIAGNHDILRSGQFYTSALDVITAADMECVYVYKQMSTLNMPGVSFTFLPFRDRRSFNTDSNSEALKLLMDKIPYELSGIDLYNVKVIVGHLALEGSIPVGDEIDDMTNELFCPISMFKGYDFGFFGHIHKPQVLSKSPYIAHVGSMDLSDFGEAKQKKFIVAFNSKDSEPYKYLQIPTRPLKQISVSVPDNIVNATDYVVADLIENHNDLKKAIVRLNVSLNNADMVNIDRSVVEKCLTDLGAFHIERINEERKVIPIKKHVETEGIDNTVNETTAIKMYADANVIERKDEFVAVAMEIVREFSEIK
jgi:DNA repair exonuclease SbcCD nuclease subunit